MQDQKPLITAAHLSPIFVGKRIIITHTGNTILRDLRGTCSAFYDHEGGHMDIELDGKYLHGFIPDILTNDSVEGDVGPATAGRRKIKCV